MKKTKRKIRIRGLIFLLLFLYLIAMLIYYIVTLPVKSIVVHNNKLVTENEILTAALIKDDALIFKINTKKLAKRIENISLIHSVKVKRNILGTVTITVEENKILFYNVLNNEIVLSDKRVIKNDSTYVGIPTLVNYVPSEIYSSFILAFSKIDSDVIAMVSEIEYNPEKFNEITTDEERFLFRMNDGNMVYINNTNMEKFNKYQSIYASVDTKGIFYLNSDGSNKNYVFKKFSEVTEEETKDED